MSQLRGEVRTKCINSVSGHYLLPGPYAGKPDELKAHVEKLLEKGVGRFLSGGLNLTVSHSYNSN